MFMRGKVMKPKKSNRGYQKLAKKSDCEPVAAHCIKQAQRKTHLILVKLKSEGEKLHLLRSAKAKGQGYF